MAPLTAEQLEAHNTGVGSSDTGTALDLNPWKSSFELYQEKVGEVERADLSEVQAVHFGTVLEEPLAQEFVRRTGLKVRRRNTTFVHKEHPFIVCHPDRTIDGQRTILECKTAGAWSANDWGPDGTDQVPDHYLVQVHQQMLVMDYPRAVLAVLIGGQEYRQYEFQRDPEMDKLILDGLCSFWYDHVLPKVPPEPTTLRDLNSLKDAGTSIVAEPAIAQAAIQLSQVKAEIKELEATKVAFEKMLKDFMREHSTLVSAEGETIATWKAAKDSQRFDSKAFKAAHPDMYEEYCTTVAGSRRFLIK